MTDNEKQFFGIFLYYKDFIQRAIQLYTRSKRVITLYQRQLIHFDNHTVVKRRCHCSQETDTEVFDRQSKIYSKWVQRKENDRGIEKTGEKQ